MDWLDAMISMPMFATISNLPIERIPMRSLVYSTKYDWTDQTKRSQVQYLVQQALSGPYSHYTNHFTSNSQAGRIDQINQIMALVFNPIIIVVMLLCFFSLSASMRANLADQSKEIGILRAVGFGKFKVLRLFVYEAFILVMASSFLGILIGTVMGYSLSL